MPYASNYHHNASDDEADDDENASYKQYEVREGIVFLIELSQQLFAPASEGRSQMLEILQGVNELVAELVITAPSTGIGVYFYNCENTSSKFRPKLGLNKLFKLNDINVSNMKLLNDTIADDAADIAKVKDRFPVRTTVSKRERLPAVLNSILDEFNAKTHYNIRKLVWFTDNEKPYASDDIKSALRTSLDDFAAYRIGISPFFLSSGDAPFDMSLYKDIFLGSENIAAKHEATEPESENSDDEDDDDEAEISDFKSVSRAFPKHNVTTLLPQIKAAILRLREVRRIQFACNIVLGDGEGVGGKFGCTVKGYTLYSHEKISKKRNVYNKGDELKLVHSETRVKNTVTEEEVDLDPGEAAPEAQGKTLSERKDALQIRKGYSIPSADGEEVFHFDLKTHRYMKSYAFDHDPHVPGVKVEKNDDFESTEDLHSFLETPYLKLLCFRDIKNYVPFFNMGPPVFVTADIRDGLGSASSEGGYKNSFTVFSSLYQSCKKLGKYGLLFGCIKKNSRPSLFALYPTGTQNSSREGDGDQFPDGFLLIKQPWLNDTRSLPDYMFSQAYKNPEGQQAVPENLLEEYKLLVSRYFLQGYNPVEYPNPSLNFYYDVIKHELLQIEMPSEAKKLEKVDVSIRRLVQLRDSIQSLDALPIVQKINGVLNKYGNLDVLKRASEGSGSGAKRAKSEPLNERAVLTAWKNDTLLAFTVAQLKGFADHYPRIKRATKKAEIIENIVQFLESRQ